jgi:outer membrane protein TolC
MLIAKKTLVRHGRMVLKIQQADLDMMKDKLAQGTASEGEVAGRKLAVEDTSLQVARGEAEFASLRRTFARLAGLGELAEDAVPLEIPRPAYSAERTASLLAAYLRNGARSTFAVEVALMRIREADLNYRIAQVRLLPKFGAQAGYSVLNTTNASATSVSQTGVAQQSVGISGDWRIFDGFATKGAKLEALATKRARERELQTAVETALDTAQQLERDLALDVREMDQCDIRRTLAQGGIDRTKEDIGLGKQPATALDAATANLYITEFNCANARAKFLWQWSEFVSLAATDPMVNNLPNHYAREKR